MALGYSLLRDWRQTRKVGISLGVVGIKLIIFWC